MQTQAQHAIYKKCLEELAKLTRDADSLSVNRSFPVSAQFCRCPVSLDLSIYVSIRQAIYATIYLH